MLQGRNLTGGKKDVQERQSERALSKENKNGITLRGII